MWDAKLVTGCETTLDTLLCLFLWIPVFMPIYHFYRESHIPLFCQCFKSISNYAPGNLGYCNNLNHKNQVFSASSLRVVIT